MAAPAKLVAISDSRQPQARGSARFARAPGRAQAPLTAPAQKVRRAPENKHEPLISYERVPARFLYPIDFNSAVKTLAGCAARSASDIAASRWEALPHAASPTG